MATICPKCWSLGQRTQVECVSNGKVEEYTPVDLLPDGTMIKHPKRTTTSVYGMCSCPKCGHKEDQKDPSDNHDSTEVADALTLQGREALALMAASPDLLQALLGCMKQIEAFDPGGCHESLPGGGRLAEAREAVAKTKRITPKMLEETQMTKTEKGDQPKVIGKPRRRCQSCGHLRYDVKLRGNAYQNDVNNDPTAEWVCCDECDYQNRMDI